MERWNKNWCRYFFTITYFNYQHYHSKHMLTADNALQATNQICHLEIIPIFLQKVYVHNFYYKMKRGCFHSRLV
jgi:hypothetical protein